MCESIDTHKLFLSNLSSEKVPSWLCYIGKGRGGFGAGQPLGQIMSLSLLLAPDCWLHSSSWTQTSPIMGIIVLVRWNVGRVCVWPSIACLQCSSKRSASLREVCFSLPPRTLTLEAARRCSFSGVPKWNNNVNASYKWWRRTLMKREQAEEKQIIFVI